MNEQSYTKFLRNFYRTHCIYSSGAKNSRTVRVFTKNYMQSGNCVEWRKSLERKMLLYIWNYSEKRVQRRKNRRCHRDFFSREKMIMPCDMNTHNLHTNSLPAYLDNILRSETNTLDIQRFFICDKLLAVWGSMIKSIVISNFITYFIF